MTCVSIVYCLLATVYSLAVMSTPLAARYYKMIVCSFVSVPAVTTHCVCIFHSPVAGFSFLVFEVF